MQQTWSAHAMQESASMQVGGDLFDAIDVNHDGVIDRAEFDRVMFGSQGAMACQGGSATMLAGGSASMLAVGSTTVLTQQQRQQQQAGWFERRSSVYDGASAAMSVGGTSIISPGASVSMMPASASVSVYPPVAISPAASVTVMPPNPIRMFTTTTTTPQCRTRSLSPPASYGRQSILPQHLTPAWL